MDISEHEVSQVQKTAHDKMAALARQVPNGGQAMALQLAIIELETLKGMLFDEDGPLVGRDLEHAYLSLLAFNGWADDMQRTLTRARLTNLGSDVRPNGI